MESIRTLEQLRAIVGEPGELTAHKMYPYLNLAGDGLHCPLALSGDVHRRR
jgi:hypothetical protein